MSALRHVQHRVGDLHPLLDRSYPLGDDWLADPLTTPKIAGYPTFWDGCRAAARPLVYEPGTVLIRYGCLSAFAVRITSLDDGSLKVAVAIGSAPAVEHTYEMLAFIRWEPVGRNHQLQDDDARAVTYLLREVSRAIATIGEGEDVR